MRIKELYKYACVGLLAVTCFACKKEARLEMTFSDRFEGQKVELLNYCDSTVVDSVRIKDGKAEFVVRQKGEHPLFAGIMVDGRLRAFYIAEPGRAELPDSLSVAKGTPLNDRFSSLLASLDSIENLDDMDGYVRFSEEKYNELKGTPLGDYFCIEWLKYSDPAKVDSLLDSVPGHLRDSKRVKYYENFARHRALTAPGQKYTDFEGRDARGRKLSLSSTLKPGAYTLIDFWASWCPYCIKELPELKSLYSDYKDKGFEIVGVAVRDKADDTDGAVEKHEIPWTVVYDTQRIPYDIYGFSGIPHHILLDPDGVIVSRGENASKIRERLDGIYGADAQTAD